MNSIQEVGTHPIAEMNRLVRGRASREERSLAVRHLLAGCSSCAEHMAQEVGWKTSRGMDLPNSLGIREHPVRRIDDRVEAVMERMSGDLAYWIEERLEESKRTSSLAEALAQGSIADPLPLLEAMSVPQRQDLCERLVEKSVAARLEDPKVTLRCAELAVRLASDPLDDEENLAELQVRVWCELGNARRINNDLTGSDAAFTIAGNWLDKVPQCDPLLKAEYLSLLASLRDYQRRMKEALTLVRQAAVIYERHGNGDAVAKIRIKEAAILAKGGELDEAMKAVWSGLQRLGPEADPSVLVAGVHNLVHLMADRGAYGEASHLLEAVEPLYRRFAGRMVRLRLDWLKAQIDLKIKGPVIGVRSLEAIQRRFRDHELPFETAVVSLELAQIYARTGDTSRLCETAEFMLPIFEQLGATRDLIAALATLRAAGDRQEATLATIERLRQGLGVEGIQTL